MCWTERCAARPPRVSTKCSEPQRKKRWQNKLNVRHFLRFVKCTCAHCTAVAQAHLDHLVLLFNACADPPQVIATWPRWNKLPARDWMNKKCMLQVRGTAAPRKETRPASVRLSKAIFYLPRWGPPHPPRPPPEFFFKKSLYQHLGNSIIK